MLLPILTYPDKRLFNISTEIKEITDDIRALAANMAHTMYEAKGVGLAAPQVNNFIRMIVIDQTGPDERGDLITLVNPSYTILDRAKAKDEEGCLSVLDYKDKVARYKKILVHALDLNGDKLEFEAEEYMAVIVQHEIDHLDGKLFLNHLSHLKRTIYDKRLKNSVRDEEE